MSNNSNNSSENFTPYLGDDEYGSSSNQCLLEDDSVDEDSICSFDSIRLSKQKTKHPKALIIQTPESSGSYTYYVVSGRLGGKNESKIDLDVSGIQVVECKKNHENAVVQILSPDMPSTDQKSKHVIKTGFEYTDFSSLFTSWYQPIEQFSIFVQTCQNGRQEISVVTYSDLKLKFDLGLELNVSEKQNLELKISGTAGMSCDNDDSEGSIGLEFETTTDEEEDKKKFFDRLTLKFEVKKGSTKLGFPVSKGSFRNLRSGAGAPKEIMDTLSRVTKVLQVIYDGMVKTRDLLSVLNGANKKYNAAIKYESKRKLEWSFSKDSKVTNEIYWQEDDTSFEVGRVWDFKLEGTLFSISWSWNFADKVFLAIPWVGKVIAYLNDKALDSDLGGIEIRFGCGGKVKLKNAFAFKKLYFNNGDSKTLKHDKPILLITLQLSLEAKGAIRVSVRVKYIAKGKFSAGVKAEMKDDGSGFFLYNSKVIITGAVYKETCSYELNTSPTPFEALVPDQCSQDPLTENEIIVFDEKEILDIK